MYPQCQYNKLLSCFNDRLHTTYKSTKMLSVISRIIYYVLFPHKIPSKYNEDILAITKIKKKLLRMTQWPYAG